MSSKEREVKRESSRERAQERELKRELKKKLKRGRPEEPCPVEACSKVFQDNLILMLIDWASMNY